MTNEFENKPPVAETVSIKPPENLESAGGIDAAIDTITIPPELQADAAKLAEETGVVKHDLETRTLSFLHPKGKSELLTTIRKKLTGPFARLFSFILAATSAGASFEIDQEKVGQHSSEVTDASQGRKLSFETDDAKTEVGGGKLEGNAGGQESESVPLPDAEYAPHFEAADFTESEISTMETQMDEFAEVYFQNSNSNFILNASAMADVAGSGERNQKLSDERAVKVADIYVNGLVKRGVDMSRVTVQTKGEGEGATVIDENGKEVRLSGKEADKYAMKKLGIKTEKQLQHVYERYEKGELLPDNVTAFLKDFLQRNVSVSFTGQTQLHEGVKENPSEKTKEPTKKPTSEIHEQKTKNIIVYVLPDGRLEIFYGDQPNTPYAERPFKKPKLPKQERPKIDDGEGGNDEPNPKKPKKKKPQTGFVIEDPFPAEEIVPLQGQGKVPLGPMKINRFERGGFGKTTRGDVDAARRESGKVRLDEDGHAVPIAAESFQPGELKYSRDGRKKPKPYVRGKNRGKDDVWTGARVSTDQKDFRKSEIQAIPARFRRNTEIEMGENEDSENK